MNELKLKESNFGWPEIIMNKEQCEFSIIGHMYNCEKEFYQPVFNWIEKYTQNANDSTLLVLKIETYNTCTLYILLDLLNLFKNLLPEDKTFEVIWYYPEDNQDIYEDGEDLSIETGISFKIIAY
ncbi:MAG: DUF1987 domain-containing protein [Chloroflexia bacterium]|nr:DUF1987 domain-containing protein [Chloroflexia bacterium]